MALTVADLQTKFSADLSGLNKGIATADRKIKGFASGFAGNAGAFALGGLIERGIAGGLSALNRLGQAGVGALASATMDAADFNAQISAIAANANATADEVAPLKQLILDLGIDPKLKVSATEAADAVDQLAAIPAGGAPADAVGLDHGDRIAPFREGEGGGHAGKSGTDDADVG